MARSLTFENDYKTTAITGYLEYMTTYLHCVAVCFKAQCRQPCRYILDMEESPPLALANLAPDPTNASRIQGKCITFLGPQWRARRIRDK